MGPTSERLTSIKNKMKPNLSLASMPRVGPFLVYGRRPYVSLHLGICLSNGIVSDEWMLIHGPGVFFSLSLVSRLSSLSRLLGFSASILQLFCYFFCFFKYFYYLFLLLFFSFIYHGLRLHYFFSFFYS